MIFLSLKPMGWSGYKPSNTGKIKHKLLQRNVFSHSEKSWWTWTPLHPTCWKSTLQGARTLHGNIKRNYKSLRISLKDERKLLSTVWPGFSRAEMSVKAHWGSATGLLILRLQLDCLLGGDVRNRKTCLKPQLGVNSPSPGGNQQSTLGLKPSG